MRSFRQFCEVMTDAGPNQPMELEFTTPQGTTGKRKETKMKYGPARDMTGHIIKTTVFKSYSSRR
jgi:hypothetical protein